MLKSRLRITSCFLWVALTLLGFYPSSPAHAESFRTEGASDFYFELEAGSTFTVRSYAQSHNIDSQLWLYNSANTAVAVNDDYFGLDSYISYNVQESGTYRLRTSVCCGDPNRWYGQFYTIDTNSVPTVVPSLAPTTTLAPSTTTTLPPTTTTVAPTTTTTTTSTTTLPPTTTSTTSTTTSTTTTSTTTTTTSTTVPRTTTTTTTEPAMTVATTTTTTTSVAPSTTLFVPVAAQTTTSLPTPTTELTTTSSSSTTIPPEMTNATQVDPEVSALLGSIATLSQSEVAAAVDNIIEKGISKDEATALATNAEVLKAVSAEQAAEIFDAVVVSDLNDAQAEQLIEAVQDAPEAVRATFEDKINVFGGKFNKYVPIGSKINVGQRKVLIAASGVLFMAPTVSVSSSTSGSASGESKSRRKK